MIKDYILDASKLPPFVPDLSFRLTFVAFFILADKVTQVQLATCVMDGRLMQNRGQGQRKRKSKRP